MSVGFQGNLFDFGLFHDRCWDIKTLCDLLSHIFDCCTEQKQVLLHSLLVMTWLQNNRLTRNFNGPLLFATGLMMLSQINFGLDLVAFSNTQAMDAFEERFGQYNAKTGKYKIEPYFLSLLNSLTYIGQAFGVITGSFITRKYGRRVSFFVMGGWANIAAILLVSAQSKEQILVGRIINYIYLGQELVTVPIMQAEIVPPSIRGMVVGTYQLGTMVNTSIQFIANEFELKND